MAFVLANLFGISDLAFDSAALFIYGSGICFGYSFCMGSWHLFWPTLLAFAFGIWFRYFFLHSLMAFVLAILFAFALGICFGHLLDWYPKCIHFWN